jgi:hypothetical protein
MPGCKKRRAVMTGDSNLRAIASSIGAVRPSFFFARSVTGLTHLYRFPPLKSRPSDIDLAPGGRHGTETR